MLRKSKSLLCGLLITAACVSQLSATEATETSSAKRTIGVITAPGASTTDELALLSASKEADFIETTFHYPGAKTGIVRTMLAMTGRQGTPVYAGVGPTDETSRKDFSALYPGWAGFFGWMDAKVGEKAWYPDFGKAYGVPKKTNYQGPQKAIDAIISSAKAMPEGQKLDLVGLAPLHNLAAALAKDPSITSKIRLYTMGAGRWDKVSDAGQYNITGLSYNWGVSFPVVQKVLNSGIETIVLPSQLTENVTLTKEEAQVLGASTQKTVLGKLLWQAIENWRGGVFKNGGTLANSAAWMMAINPEKYIGDTETVSFTFPCLDETGKVKESFKTFSGLYAKNLTMMTMMKVKESNVTLVTSVKNPDDMRKKILTDIIQQFYPGMTYDAFQTLVTKSGKQNMDQ